VKSRTGGRGKSPPRIVESSVNCHKRTAIDHNVILQAKHRRAVQGILIEVAHIPTAVVDWPHLRGMQSSRLVPGDCS
jgi:hypothetical protein